MSDGMCRACHLLLAMSGKGRYFCVYPRLEKNAHSCLLVYARRRAATFDTPVLHNVSKNFEVTTFSWTVEMARVSTSHDLVYIWGTDYLGEYVTAHGFQGHAAWIYSERDLCQIDARFDTPAMAATSSK